MDEEQLKKEINHILESGANDIRLVDLFNKFSGWQQNQVASQFKRDMYDLERKHENLLKQWTDAHARFNSKIMSVYYLLDIVSDAGTHSEKRNVIMYLKLTLQKMIHNGDPLPLDPDALPF